MSKERKVIDFRCRPPLKPYGGLFNLRLNLFGKRPTVLANPATHGKTPSVISNGVDQPGGMEAWWKAIDDAGSTCRCQRGSRRAWKPIDDGLTLADFGQDKAD